MKADQMKQGTPYIVTKRSDCGTFETGEHIMLKHDGSITCWEAMGWIDAEDVPGAIFGMEVEIDQSRIRAHKEYLMAELGKLEGESNEG